jgi:hypothetical protein
MRLLFSTFIGLNLYRSVVYVKIEISWKPECVLSVNIGWRILVNVIRKSMLKLTTNVGFHELFLKYHTNYTILDEYEWKQSANLYISIWTDKNAM